MFDKLEIFDKRYEELSNNDHGEFTTLSPNSTKYGILRKINDTTHITISETVTSSFSCFIQNSV